MTEKLETELEQVEIKQTRKIDPIRFRDDAINKIRKEKYNFGKKRYLDIPFDVSKDSHQKGLKLRVYKGSGRKKQQRKFSMFRFWFNGKADKYKLGIIQKPLVSKNVMSI